MFLKQGASPRDQYLLEETVHLFEQHCFHCGVRDQGKAVCQGCAISKEPMRYVMFPR